MVQGMGLRFHGLGFRDAVLALQGLGMSVCE